MKRFVLALALLAVALPSFAKAADDAPISLADADGQELILDELSVKAAIHGMLSLTEVELRFRNPKAKRIEGRFAFTLPANAAISRFAKDVNGQLMEGEVVERLRANQVYEQFLHQMRDPALLEQDQGNRFSARIFPIEANAPVRILLSYSTLLPLRDGARSYTFPLRGIAKVNHLTFRAFVSPLPGESSGLQHSTLDVTSMDERDYTPSKDIELTWKSTDETSRSRLLTAGDFYLGSFRPSVRTAESIPPHRWRFYVDTSASAAESASHRIEALESILHALPAGDAVDVVAFDQELAPLASGSASDLATRLPALLRSRLFLGGTDLGQMFRAIASAANADRERGYVVVSDLVATVGKTQPNEINDAIRAIPATAIVHALVLGPRQDSAVAKTLTAGRGRIIEVPFSDQRIANARAAVRALRRPLGASFDVSDPNAEWVYPSHVDDVHEGDEILIVGKRNASSEPAVRLVTQGNANVTTGGTTKLPAGAFAPLLEREAYRAYLEYLAVREANEPSDAVRRALASEQVKISTEQRVVIPRTTMLVLESEWDYQRFRIDRRALAAILTVGDGTIARLDRPPVRFAPDIDRVAKTQPPQFIEESVQEMARDGAAPRASRPAGRVETTNAPARDERERQSVDFDAAWIGNVQSGAAAGQAIAVTAEAPVMIPSPPPPPAPLTHHRPDTVPVPQEPRREERKSRDASWTHASPPSRDRMRKLQEQIEEHPLDRDAYNELGEALAAWHEWTALRELAIRWQPFDAENPQVYELLGIADEHLDKNREAARAIGSLIEVSAAKPELLQRAGLLLLRVGQARIAETPLRRALELRPDRVNSYRHLALMLWQEGRHEEAARVLEAATRQTFPNWYGDAQRVVREELGYVYRSWILREPKRRAEIADRAREHDVDLGRRDAIRVSLAWETDANDVDLHVVDPRGEECFYSHKNTATGLELYEDIRQGLGPEVIRTRNAKPGTYHVGVNYFAAGPMGVSRGIVIVLRDNGDDRDPEVDIRPFRLAEGVGKDMRYVAAVEVK